MRWLVNYIRSCFCKHDWECLEEDDIYSRTDYWGRAVEPYKIGKKWTYRCKKCCDMRVHKNYG